MTLETSCNSNIIQTINSMFCLLLTKLKVVNERISKLLESFSLKEKITYLRNSIWYFSLIFSLIFSFLIDSLQNFLIILY